MPDELIEAPAELADVMVSPYAGCEGVRGKPEVLSRVSNLRFVHEEFATPLPPGEKLTDIVPDLQRPDAWYGLTSSARCFRLEVREGLAEELAYWPDAGFPFDAETGLRISACSRYEAVFRASGQEGFVFDLATGLVTARLDRGEYRPENSLFPLAFFEFDGCPLLVTATAWNRLDVIDPVDGRVLTSRALAKSQSGETAVPEALDYFHAQLTVSPDNRWIVDNGWVWAPVGVVRSWNLPDWVTQNRWESEDGASVRALASRAYYWDGPICWIGNSLVALWGWGCDDEWLIPAVRLFDVATGEKAGWFAGPEVRPASIWPPKTVAPSLFFDKYLFSVSNAFGTAVWDVRTGERLHQETAFVPVQYHPRSCQFLTERPNSFVLSRLEGEDTP